MKTHALEKEYLLKIDYDSRSILRYFKRRVSKVYYVFYFKRDSLPTINVIRAERTRKGWHVWVRFKDKNLAARDGDSDTVKLETLILQNALGSDSTRTLFDMLRVHRGDKDWNLMFKYKNGYVASEDPEMRRKLNDIALRVKTLYEKKGGVIMEKDTMRCDMCDRELSSRLFCPKCGLCLSCCSGTYKLSVQIQKKRKR